MRTALIVLVMLSLAAMASATMDNDVAPSNPPSNTDAIMDFLYAFDLPNLQCVGVGWDGTDLWVSAGDSDTGFCEFYRYDLDGNLLEGPVHQGGGATGWGNRDMCHDGNHMFGSFSSAINGYSDMSTYAGSFTGPLSPNRAMAWDGQYFYTSGFGQNLYMVDWNGSWGSVATSYSLGGPWAGAYGLAFDSCNNCLWMTTADYSGDIYQLSMMGLLLGTYSTLPAGYDIAGGCTMVNIAGTPVLCILEQSSPDQLAFYDVDCAATAVDEGTWGGIKTLFR